MKYASLHHHSTFSFLDGYGLPEAHVRRAGDLGMEAMALTEHGNVSSHVQFEKAAKDEGIKPIFGVELYTGPIDADHRKQRKNHLTVLSEDVAGYQNLLRLVSRGYAEGFYYEPTVSGGLLADHADGLIVLSGCTGSLLATSLVGGKNIAKEDASYRRARKVAQSYKRTFGDRYYLEVQAFPGYDLTCDINKGVAELSAELGIGLVATGDVHYTTPDENEMQQILHNVRGGNKQTLEDQARAWGYDLPLCPPTTDKSMVDRLVGTGLTRKQALAAVANSAEIAARCNVELPRLPQLRYPLPDGIDDPLVLWRRQLNEGWKYRGIPRQDRKTVAAYRDRLRYEMSIIEGKDFVDYFLVVGDIVRFAKDSGIPVGPARGSAAASLVCYLLRITEVDPIRYPNLVFERFIDTTRQDLPDIDLDFDDSRRGEIRDYAGAKYGSDCVGNIGSVTQYKSKLSLDDVARVYRVPIYEVEKVKELLIERSSGDLRASATIEDTVENFQAAKEVFEKYPMLNKAMDLEGQIKGLGIHAAGLVVANGPLTDVCAIYERTVNGEKRNVISADKYDAEYLNVVKIDVLGLNTMGMIRLALEMIGMTLEDLYALPLDDPATIKGFQDNDVVGIFQFDGRAMRSVNAELQPDNFTEICDVCALARPGPLHNNASAEYIDVKRGRKEPRRYHPILDDITKHTNYQIVYQEQILRIVMEIGGFDWTHAAYIRKIISRKIGEQEFNRQWDRFWKGAQERGLDEDTARAIWGACITAGSYAFNNAHTVSYGMIAYWTMWLKVHHPQEFYVAALTKYKQKDKKKGQDKQLELLRDADRHGLEILPPDVGLSELEWKPEGMTGNAIRAGLCQIPGIGETMAQNIINWRNKKKSIFDVGGWYDLLEIRGFGEKKVESIINFVGQEDPFEIHKLEKQLNAIRAALRKGIWAGSKRGKYRLPVPTHTSLEVPYSRGRNILVTWVGLIRHRNLRELFEVNFSRTGVPLDPESVKDPELNEWVIMVGEDEGELVTFTVDRWKYPKFKEALWGIKLQSDMVLIRGVKKGYQSRRAVYVQDLWVIEADEG